MVTSQRMMETEIGYRGSKSSFSNSVIPKIREGVKEQRVDGSCCKMNNHAIKVYSK